MPFRKLILSALAAAVLSHAVSARAVVALMDDENTTAYLPYVALLGTAGYLFTLPGLYVAGILLLDEKSGSATLKPISQELAREAGVTPQEQVAFNSEQNLAFVNAALDDVSHQVREGTLDPQNANAKFVETLQPMCSADAMKAYFKVRTALARRH